LIASQLNNYPSTENSLVGFLIVLSNSVSATMTATVPNAALDLNANLCLKMGKVQPPLPCIVKPMLLDKLRLANR
jgi:glycerol uptake facilitator-like aquaporin